MTQPEPAETTTGLDSAISRPPAGELFAFLEKSLVIAGAEWRKLLHDPTELLTRAVQPALWMIIFGQVFTRLHAVPTGALSYLDFLAPGILAQSVLFVAIYTGIGVIWERDLGLVHKLLVSPTHRGALVLGKALSAGMRALSQAAVVYLLAFVLGVRLDLSPAALVGVIVFVFFGAAVFSTFSLAVACIVKTRERFISIGQLLTMPLFFASNALYPFAAMPAWLRAVAHVNPLSYQVDAMRALMLRDATSTFGLALDLVVLLTALLLLLVLTARLYPRMAR